MEKYYSTKTYGHNVGLSACFRQPSAESHCRFLHGYSLQFKFTFEAKALDERNWVVDFGALKPLKQWLEQNFDHKVIIDQNDPHIEWFQHLESLGVASLTILDGVGVEKFAFHAWKKADALVSEITNDRCRCVEVECAEHGANSAIYRNSFEDLKQSGNA